MTDRAPGPAWTWPIISQYPGHVITLDESEASIRAWFSPLDLAIGPVDTVAIYLKSLSPR